MNVCFIGKYPPIEGGVSAENYWTAYAMATRGHHVYVVTNANEVEARFRLTIGRGDAEWFEPKPVGGGAVTIISSSVPELRLGYIPSANPFVSKLASLATQTIRTFECKAIVANYFEPYGVAGFLASQFTGIPLAIKHAGSDISRLMREWELATTYKEILKRADAVLTLPRMRERFVGFGVDPNRVGIDAPFALPTNVFEPTARSLMELAGAYDVPEVHRANGLITALDSAMGAPRIGIYGKIGVYKGSFDLVAALGALRRDGFETNLFAMTQGYDWLFRRFCESVVEQDLNEHSYMVPFLPNWRVPNFLRTCSLVCFLERDFPIAMHGPVVPREILACGVPLVLSKEIADKQFYRRRIVDRVNMWIVNDPKDHEELAFVLREALTSDRLTEVGARGHELSQELEDYDRFTQFWDSFLGELLESRSTPVFRLSSASTLSDRIRQSLPLGPQLLGPSFKSALEEFEQDNPSETSPAAFLDFVRDRKLSDIWQRISLAPDALRYLRRSFEMMADGEDDHAFAFSKPDSTDGRALTIEYVGDLRPVLTRLTIVEEFPEALFSSTATQADRRYILFAKTPNLERCELVVNGASRKLLHLCDGTRTTRRIVEDLEKEIEHRESGGVAVKVEVAQTVVAALARFHRAGVLAFQE